MAQVELEQFIPYFLQHQELADDKLVSLIVEAGVDKPIAERIVGFGPIAFGRVLLSHIATFPFSMEFGLSNSEKLFALKEEPIFIELTKLAMFGFHDGRFDRDAFKALAMRSTEVDMVNKLLNAGRTVDDLLKYKFAPPILLGFSSLRHDKPA